MAEIEFFFDVSSPWTRLAFHNIQPILEETGSTATWRPFLVGGVFNAVNESVYALRENPDSPKFRHLNKWLQEWARIAGVPMNFPSPHHPAKSVAAMRCCCVLEADQENLYAFATKAFDAYFREQRNLDDDAVLVEIANEIGLDGASILAQSTEQPAKDRLRANTQEAIDRGSYGSPTIFINGDELYFGNDQMPLIRMALKQ